MATGSLEYRVVDRSILLPYYKRWLIEPLLPHIPARVTPNAITHAGHLALLAGTVQLLALWPSRGVGYVAATLLMQAQVWCDNADGGHARRTGQSSALGEFLDHGLDVLNVVYIALLTCMGLGVSPGWWVALAVVVPTAVSVTYWEQSHTGTFQLGLLNQIESSVVLSGVLLTAAVLGHDVYARVSVAGVSLQLAFCLWTVIQIGVGIARGLWRVARLDRPALASVAPVLALDVAVGVAAATGGLTAPAAVTVGVAVNVFFAVRMLTLRIKRERPRVERSVLAAAAVCVASAVLREPAVSWPLAALAALGFGAATMRDARTSVRRVVG